MFVSNNRTVVKHEVCFQSAIPGILRVGASVSLERVRVRKTRSGAVTEAIEKWLQAEEVGDDDRRYVEGYLRHPERVDEAATIAGAVVTTWEPWE
jgi:hypothetical protein